MSELQARIAALRDAGGGRFDPVRFRFLEVLAQRAAVQPERVRRILQDRLLAGLDDYLARMEQPRQVAAGAPVAATCLPLAQLNAHIRRAAGAADGTSDELPSVRRFRRAWSAGRVQDQLELAVSRKPANAGPLNSHALVLESLALMEQLSPAYLGRFMAQVEALQWLEQVQVKAAKAPARSRRKAD
ncbi:MAG: hypothetical protein JWP65_1651 [Ramlibacter sp.]|uniref:DUF2894 domain-containing protein n=1 Tax=Ramlibacter sp. TaxID=1917967 RepID=UPI00260D8CE9|nr:DUF2894 domain-containing protein [Ramlibacter sp.]MDB5751230.1 hypothetical protein [Ramlibacter sp.]